MERTKKSKKRGVFGGAFNPIHIGHLRTAEDVYEILSLDEVCFIPSGTPAFIKPVLASARHRYEMVSMAIKDNPHFSVSDIEIQTEGISYSVDTMRKIQSRDEELFFIIGIDAFHDLPKWKEPNDLVQMAHIVVISRPGYSFSDLSSSPYLKAVPASAFSELDSGMKDVFSVSIAGEKRCFLCRVTGMSISASAIRKMLMEGKNVKYLLPDSVKSYIISHKLYTDGKQP